MKEELQSKLVEILTSIQTAAGKASDFAMEQLPDIAQSYIVYGRVANTLGVALCAVFVLAGALCLWRAYKEGRKTRGEYSDGLCFGLCMGGIVSVTTGTVAGSAVVPSTLLVWFAPKVWLLKEIAGMLK
jgi:hypothetical protein